MQVAKQGDRLIGNQDLPCFRAMAVGRTNDALSRQTGMNRDDLLEQFSQHLPEVRRSGHAERRLPSAEEASRTV
jgi:uncharacterized protein YidB (DUF937 family)